MPTADYMDYISYSDRKEHSASIDNHGRNNSVYSTEVENIGYGESSKAGYALGDSYEQAKDTNNGNSNPFFRNVSEDSSTTQNMADKKVHYEDLEYAEPLQDRGALSLFKNRGRFPLEQQIENKRRGIGRQRYPVVAWTLTIAMVAVMIYELVRNSQAQGTPISTKPVFNPMLGPSQSALINFGARYPPCMKNISSIPSDIQFGCLNNTANPPTSLCSLEDICGFGGFHGKEPNQWWRFITPIFIHAGIIHIVLNMLAQVLVSAQVEREMGSGGFIILYFASGIFGNVLGGNFALLGAPSVGASGAIFGTVAATWIDLFTHWRFKYRPVRQLVALVVELIIGIGLGYIPGVDNFAHLGGFFMGLLVAATLYPVISTSKRHKMIVWGFRIATIPVAIVLMVVLIRNFYTGDPYAACSGCRYLSCFPTNANNHCKGDGLTITTTGGSSL